MYATPGGRGPALGRGAGERESKGSVFGNHWSVVNPAVPRIDGYESTMSIDAPVRPRLSHGPTPAAVRLRDDMTQRWRRYVTEDLLTNRAAPGSAENNDPLSTDIE